MVFLTDSKTYKVKHILSRLNDEIAKVNAESNKSYRIEYSCGVSHYNSDSPLYLEERVEEADIEMYKEMRTR